MSMSQNGGVVQTTEVKKENSEDSEKADGGLWGWIIVAVAFFTQFIAEGVTYTFGVFLVEISNEFSSTGKSNVSWIASIMIGQYHAMGPVGSGLVNKFGSRTVSVAGAILAALGFGISYFAKNVILLYFTIGLLSGLGLSLLYLPSMVSVAQYFEKRRSLAIGISVCGSGVGTLFFEWITGIILKEFVWREALLFTAGMILCAVPVSLLYRPVQRKTAEITSENKPAEVFNDSTCSNGTHITVKNLPENADSKKCMTKMAAFRKILDLSLLQNPVFLMFAICDVFMGIGFNVPYLYLPEIEQSVLGESKSTLLGIVGATNIAGRAIMGFLGDHKWLPRHFAYSSSLMVCGLATIGIPFLTTITWLRVYAAVYGSFMGAYMTLKSVILVEILGLDKLTDAYGILLLFQAVGFLIGPPIVGLLFDEFESYDYGFYFAGTMIALSGLLLYFIPVVHRYLKYRTKSKSIAAQSLVSQSYTNSVDVSDD